VIASGDGPAWRDVFVEVFSHNHVEQPFLVPAVAEPLIVWVMSGEATVDERDPGGEWLSSHVSVGDFFLTRTPSPYEMRWEAHGDVPFQVMHLYLGLPLFERVASEMLGKATPPPTLRDVSGGRDETLSKILSLVHDELLRVGDQNPHFVQGLAQSLAAHLVRTYVDASQNQVVSNALPGSKLRRALRYMEAFLHEEFSLNKLAQEVGMSEFHFSRLFKKATGLSPSNFFIKRRVAKAQQLLLETDMSIIEIGMSVGYSSPSHFAQVFRRETGVTPSEYRRS
jgi:AraC family transcriptional regulator